jgi:hypothetical protein
MLSLDFSLMADTYSKPDAAPELVLACLSTAYFMGRLVFCAEGIDFSRSRFPILEFAIELKGVDQWIEEGTGFLPDEMRVTTAE